MSNDLKIKNQNVILVINTASSQFVEVGVVINDKKYMVKRKMSSKIKAQIVLPLIEKVLRNNKKELKDLTEIRVNSGPGSFTGLRVGITIANALSFVLKIPINNLGINGIVEPVYQ